ncbi:MAG: plasmid stabilization system [Parcubacteria group bacterium Gr01-1014_38]|nr:MAG: plasmid stabilization system [Parcubacteria group bacterium Gr01-1014_38]
MISNGRGSYNVFILPSARRELEGLPHKDAGRIALAIASLVSNPRPPQSTKLVGYPHDYRLRSGRYRVLYIVQDQKKTITVYKVGHRKDAYR